MHRWFQFAAIASCFYVVACDQIGDKPATADDLNTLTSEVNALKQDLATLQKRVDAIASIQTRFEMEQHQLQSRWQSAVIDPVTAQGFQRLDTSVGTLVVAVEDIQAYADGTRVRLSVGNLTSGSLSSVAGTAKYGASSPKLDLHNTDAFDKYDKWESSLKTIEFTVTRDLAPGTWNPVTLTLGGFKPSEFGHLELTMDAKSISLGKAR